jgi:hypothetical protein
MYYTTYVTPIPDVSRKSSMCISLVLDTLKYTTLKFSKMNNV